MRFLRRSSRAGPVAGETLRQRVGPQKAGDRPQGTPAPPAPTSQFSEPMPDEVYVDEKGWVGLQQSKKQSLWEYAKALLVALLVALFLRSFVIEAFKVPSGSMLPTILIGDHLFVNKFIYGLRIPLTKQWLFHYQQPQRGETVVFIYPIDEDKDFIKRVVGLPGDVVRIDDRTIFINEEQIRQERLIVEPQTDGRLQLLKAVPEPGAPVAILDPFGHWADFDYYWEYLGEEPHLVQYNRRASGQQLTFRVPEGRLFVMGDNRHHSSDSRDWGYVPMENLKGRAMFIWLSLNYRPLGVRWHRFGQWIE